MKVDIDENTRVDVANNHGETLSESAPIPMRPNTEDPVQCFCMSKTSPPKTGHEHEPLSSATAKADIEVEELIAEVKAIGGLSW